jgi:hypothetical protein
MNMYGLESNMYRISKKVKKVMCIANDVRGMNYVQL